MKDVQVGSLSFLGVCHVSDAHSTSGKSNLVEYPIHFQLPNLTLQTPK